MATFGYAIRARAVGVPHFVGSCERAFHLLLFVTNLITE